MSLLRKQLIDILIYIDDTFLRSPTFNEMVSNLQLTRDLFQKCGLSINEEKSCITPSQFIEFLGFILNMIDFSISVTPQKSQNLCQLIVPIVDFKNRKVKIRTIAKIVGKMVAMFPASDEAKMHYRTLKRFKSKQVNIHKSWNRKVRLNNDCIQELKWWLKYLNHDIKKSLHKTKTTTTLFTDSSGFGFGGIWGTECIQGRFTEKQKKLSINTKELLAIYYVLSMLGSRLHGEKILLMCDNMTAIFCIKNFSSRDVLRDVLMKKIYHLAKVHCFTIDIKYVQSKSNISNKVIGNS